MVKNTSDAAWSTRNRYPLEPVFVDSTLGQEIFHPVEAPNGDLTPPIEPVVQVTPGERAAAVWVLCDAWSAPQQGSTQDLTEPVVQVSPFFEYCSMRVLSSSHEKGATQYLMRAGKVLRAT